MPSLPMNSRSKIEQSFDGQPPYDESELRKAGAAGRINFLHRVQEQLTRKRVFWSHFNKPASRKAKDARWFIHYKGACHIVKHIMHMICAKHNEQLNALAIQTRVPPPLDAQQRRPHE